MDRLPVETLREIFQQAVREAQWSESVRAPLYISHVCRRWREISLSYGMLWSFLNIDYSGRGGLWRRTVIIDVFDTWLRRTDGCALNFSVLFNLSDVDNREVHYMAEYIVKKLTAEQRRWREVDFTWKFRASSDLTEISLTEMPVALHLRLHIDIQTEDEERIRPHISIAQSSRLQNISLTGNYFLECGDKPILSLTEIPCLEFEGAWEGWRAANVCLDLLTVAPNSEGIYAEFNPYPSNSTVYLRSTPAQQNKYPDPITHNAEFLKLQTDDPAAYVLSKLTLPSLKELALDESHGANGGGQVLLYCIRRSLPPRLHLNLYGSYGDDTFLIPILRLLPTLQTLYVCGSYVSEWMFEELTCYQDSNTYPDNTRIGVCPSLWRLCLEGPWAREDAAEECADAFCDMVESRWEYLKSFRSVELHGVDAPIHVSSIRQHGDDLERCFSRGGDCIQICAEGDPPP